VLWAIHAAFATGSPAPSTKRGSSNDGRNDPCPLPMSGLASVVIPPPGLFFEKPKVHR
jgi:hypothetical protein